MKNGIGEDEAAKIKQRIAEGKPWIIDPNKVDELKDKLEREYINCLKRWYWQNV